MNGIIENVAGFRGLLGTVLTLRVGRAASGRFVLHCANTGPYHLELRFAVAAEGARFLALAPGDRDSLELAHSAGGLALMADVLCREGLFGEGALAAIVHATAAVAADALAAIDGADAAAGDPDGGEGVPGIDVQLRPTPDADGFCGAWIEGGGAVSPRTTLLVQTDGPGPVLRQFLGVGDAAVLGRAARADWQRSAIRTRWFADEAATDAADLWARNLTINRVVGTLRPRGNIWTLLPEGSARSAARIAVDGRDAAQWRALPLADGARIELGAGERLAMRVRLPAVSDTPHGVALATLAGDDGGAQTLVLERDGGRDSHAVLRRQWVAGATRATSAFHVPDLPPRTLVLQQSGDRLLVATNAESELVRVCLDGQWLTPHVLYALPSKPCIEVFDARTGQRRLCVVPMPVGVDKRAARREDLPPPRVQPSPSEAGAIGVAAAEPPGRFGRMLADLQERLQAVGAGEDGVPGPRLYLAAATILASLRQDALDSSLQGIAFLAPAWLEHGGARTLSLLERRVRSSTTTCRSVSQFLGCSLAGVPVRELFPGRAAALAAAVGSFETAAAVFFSDHDDRARAAGRVNAAAGELLAALAALHEELLAHRCDLRTIVQRAVADAGEPLRAALGDVPESLAFADEEALTATLTTVLRAAGGDGRAEVTVRFVPGDTDTRLLGIAIGEAGVGDDADDGGAPPAALAAALADAAPVLVGAHAFRIELADDGRSAILWAPRRID